jgi:hypothetical protein
LGGERLVRKVIEKREGEGETVDGSERQHEDSE